MTSWKTTLSTVAAFAALSAGSFAHGSWIEDDVTEAFDRSERSGKRALVFVTASWCPACQTLKKEVMDAPAHQELLGGFERVRVDFDKPANHRWVEELVILGLPTVVVVNTKGKPVGRVRGYNDATSWTAELSRLRAEPDRRAALEQAAEHPTASPSAKLAFARLKLERGQATEALAILREFGATSDPVVAPEALFVLGRYFHRVKRDPESARPVWRELAVRFAQSPFAPGAWWWYARAEAETGHPGAGARALLDAAIRSPEDAGRVRRAASFAGKHPQLATIMRAELLSCLHRTLGQTTAPEERATLEALRATLDPPAAD